jgi:WD40 repeat protein
MPRSSGRSRAAAGTPGVGVRRALEWNHRAIKCVAFDPGLQKLAGGGLDGTVTLWDTVGGKLLRTFPARGAATAWFAPDSPLEGGGFEPSVPPERQRRDRGAFHLTAFDADPKYNLSSTSQEGA